MFYPAIVLDNNSFSRDGTIKVRIASFFLENMVWDFSNDPTFIKKGYDELLKYDQDFNVSVLTPYGGGLNNGLFMLPRPNTKGLVTRIGDENSTKYIWVGSFSEAISEGVSIPNDRDNTSINTGAGFGSYKIDNKNDIILRTKSLDVPVNFNPDEDDPSPFDWSKNKTDNIVTIGTKKIKMTHIDFADGSLTPKVYQTFYMGKDFLYNPVTKRADIEQNKVQLDCFDLKVKTNNNESGASNEDEEEPTNLTSSYKQTANSFTITVNGKKKDEEGKFIDIKNVISITDTGEVVIYANEREENQAEIRIKPNEITIKANEDTTIVLNKDDVIVNSRDVIINATREVRLGDGNAQVVTTNSMLSNFKLAEGIILNSSQKVKA